MEKEPYINQLQLNDKESEKNKEFFRNLYICNNFYKADKRFDKHLTRFREEDPNMTLDSFVENIDRASQITLQVRSPEPNALNYHAAFHDDDSVRRNAWVKMPCTKKNFDLVSKIYKESMGVELINEPIEKGLREYYNWRTGIGPSPWK